VRERKTAVRSRRNRRPQRLLEAEVDGQVTRCRVEMAPQSIRQAQTIRKMPATSNGTPSQGSLTRT
jgi:hypothetical protein